MKFAHVFAVGLMAVVAVGGVTEAQAHKKPRPPHPVKSWITSEFHPFQPGYTTGSETGGKVQFGTCLNLAGVQQAGDADGNGICLPAETLAGSVKGYVDAVEASCSYTKSTKWSNGKVTSFSWEKSGDCWKPRPPMRPSR